MLHESEMFFQSGQKYNTQCDGFFNLFTETFQVLSTTERFHFFIITGVFRDLYIFLIIFPESYHRDNCCVEL